MEYRIIASDLDGTLLNDKKEVSPENLAAIESHPLIKGAPVIPFSALKGEGKDELWKTIFKYTGL